MQKEKKQTEKLTKKNTTTQSSGLENKALTPQQQLRWRIEYATRRLMKPNRKEHKCPREKVIHARFRITFEFIRLEYVSNRQTGIRESGDHKESYVARGWGNEERREWRKKVQSMH